MDGKKHGRKTILKKYKVIIVGAGGHGLATAYYLGKNFGIRDVAVIEKGWLGGGNTEEILQLLGQIIYKKNQLQFTKNLDLYTKNSPKN